MIFDDEYILNLAIKISDLETIKNYARKVKLDKQNEQIIHKNIYKYCLDKNIFKIYEPNKIKNEKDKNLFQNHILNLIKNRNDNYEMIFHFLSFYKNADFDFFSEDKNSIMTTLTKIENLNNKKTKLMDLFFNKIYIKSKYSELYESQPMSKTKNFFDMKKNDKENSFSLDEILNFQINLNFKNSKGLTHSKILSDEDPTLIENLFLEKMENITKFKDEDNSYLYEKTNVCFSPIEDYDMRKLKEINIFKKFSNKNDIIKQNLTRFIQEPFDSQKINFNDLEFRILLLNLKLRSMFDINPTSLNNNNIELFFNQQHIKYLDKFMLDNILLERI